MRRRSSSSGRPVGDDAALLYLVVLRIGIDLAGDAVAHLGQRIEFAGQDGHASVAALLQLLLEGLDGRERIFQLHQLAGRHLGRRHARSDALQVADQRHLRADALAEIGLADEEFHDVEPLVDAHGTLDRHGDPTLEQAPAHRCERTVDRIGEAALAAAAVRRKKLQIADRELVDPDIIVLVDAGNRLDMRDVAVLGEFEVMEDGPGG